ncbi:hypothetical protein J4H86_02755 [Spiractinospora alimapuensis]|uniref:lactate/malate family dehydrogenase n=1 Tax=Spiractinospora alimapuensis TaxID=2820884 RepID=UPI001F18F770|nr:hypothetical protein [Spiractinospora alimapuensis]QVQ52766.1 hypothetical protein J4H86_02755 [Spiractinospora alimapuensis]
MKIGVIGGGAVGAAVTSALVHRGFAGEIVLVDADDKRAEGVTLDLGAAVPLCPPVVLRSGGMADLTAADVVVITAGVNERGEGATDRTDPDGRLRLLERNAEIYRSLIPSLQMAAPDATVLVVTDPPDPLAELTRALLGHGRVVSSGTIIDSLRFRVRLAQAFGVAARDVQATVVGEHGVSEVLLWSSATIAGTPVEHGGQQIGLDLPRLREEVEQAVRYANIDIIAGIGASQYGIGAATAALTQCVARDERRVLPVAAHSERWATTLSLPSVLGARGVVRTCEPSMTAEEHDALARSAETLREAAATVLPTFPPGGQGHRPHALR